MTREEHVHELSYALSPLWRASYGLDAALLSINAEKGNIYKTFSF